MIRRSWLLETSQCDVKCINHSNYNVMFIHSTQSEGISIMLKNYYYVNFSYIVWNITQQLYYTCEPSITSVMIQYSSVVLLLYNYSEYLRGHASRESFLNSAIWYVLEYIWMEFCLQKFLNISLLILKY